MVKNITNEATYKVYQINGTTTTVYTHFINHYKNKSEIVDICQDDILQTTTKAYIYIHLNHLKRFSVGTFESKIEYYDHGNLIL